MIDFLQSPNWKKVKEQLGNKCFDVDDYFFQTTKLPILNKYIGYMPRVDLTKIDFDLLLAQAKEANCVFVTIDPQNLTQDLDSFDFLHNQGIDAAEGFPIHLPKTVLIDLTLDEQVLLNNLKQKTRYNLKLAQKKGVSVSISNKDSDFDVFNDLYQKTVARQGYAGRSSYYLKTVWENFKEENAFIATATFEGIAIASWFIVAYEDTLTYVYGGSSEEYKNVMAPYALVWELVRLGKEYGYKYLDLFGIKDDLSDGYSRFKIGFGGEVIEHSKTVDIIVDKNLYRLIKVIYAIRNKIKFR
jgi:lipid II:glycine glycyltransferase (peptidoglycan interpeptide bridge formation enzyme)